MMRVRSALWAALVAALFISGAGLAEAQGTYPGQNAVPRIRLAGNLTLFIDSSLGSDSNPCVASGSAACLTFARAVNLALTAYDTQGFNITIQAAASQTWTNLAVQGRLVGGGGLIFDAGGGTVTGNVNGGAAILVEMTSAAALGSTFFKFQNGTITCSGGSNGLQIGGGLGQTGTGVTFGSCTSGVQIFADSVAARFLPAANYTISGGANFHYVAIGGGLIDVNNSGLTITLTGTPAFAFCFAEANYGYVLGYATYSGAATGSRHCTFLNGIIDTNTGGSCTTSTHFPGSVAGTCSTGGQFN